MDFADNLPMLLIQALIVLFLYLQSRSQRQAQEKEQAFRLAYQEREGQIAGDKSDDINMGKSLDLLTEFGMLFRTHTALTQQMLSSIESMGTSVRTQNDLLLGQRLEAQKMAGSTLQRLDDIESEMGSLVSKLTVVMQDVPRLAADETGKQLGPKLTMLADKMQVLTGIVRGLLPTSPPNIAEGVDAVAREDTPAKPVQLKEIASHDSGKTDLEK